ncbi:MAG: cysteine--tRNA ligase [Bacteroidia bacterium]|nr:cysteine--tRNA ligase [Bacteroidia bacterium]
MSEHNLYLYNSLTRKKELFKPVTPPNIGMYVCGPTVYGEPHLGHARPAITFDLLFRYLKHLGFKVRYVRNITDVGHLESDADEGEDKILKKARLEQLEPMEVVQLYSDIYHDKMQELNVLRPSIEPRASGHIIEQIQMIQKILDNGYAYVTNGSVYFDVQKYNQKYKYGKLSGRVLEDLLSSDERTEGHIRKLDGQDEKKHPADFALWKKAEVEHIMRWPSPWSDGFPGWHIECSAMGAKYLGEVFDIHGGGIDLLFPHHECEIAQSQAANGKEAVRYWVHNNLITINGQKMGKSLGNFITLEQFFTGKHSLLKKVFTPMTIRFFILQAHYRSTIDFSNESLEASEKGLQRLFKAIHSLEKIIPTEKSTVDIQSIRDKCYAALNDDLNSSVLISHLFDSVKTINLIISGSESISAEDLETFKKLFHIFVFDILGLTEENKQSESDNLLKEVVNLLLNLRQEAKAKKDFATADKIRSDLVGLGFTIKDRKDGYEWEY